MVRWQDDGLSVPHVQVSQSVHKMMKTLMRCGKMEYPPYALGEDKFFYYDGRCCYGKCPKKDLAAKARLLGREMPQVCGWKGIFGDMLCPLEATDEHFSWQVCTAPPTINTPPLSQRVHMSDLCCKTRQVWEPRLRGTNAEGKPSYSPELVPRHGTRREFMTELRVAIDAFLPHFWDHVLMQRGIKVHETLKDNVTATIRSDYAAQIKTIRLHSATCAHPESHNLCITVVGHSPYDEMVEVKKRGKCPSASTKTVRKQKVSAFFGFHPAGIKPSARSFNVLREDVSLLLQKGKAKHGEWFHKGKRLPGHDLMPELPSGLVEATHCDPIFPALEIEDDLTDGCAGQFDGKDNYHQVAEWPTKVQPEK